MLGDEKVSSLQTAQLRRWHGVVREECGAFTANRCMSFLKSILALAHEDFGAKSCAIPSNLPRRKHKPKKEILSPEEVAKLIAYAQTDKAKGIYYAFPFLTGVRVSEQLALLWDDFDFERGVIQIRRVQERDGSTFDTTKTDAGTREVPISQTLRTILLEWRLRCPRLDGDLFRVFPAQGSPQQWPLPRVGGGGPLLYGNFRKRYFVPCLKAAG
jgi:integrase